MISGEPGVISRGGRDFAIAVDALKVDPKRLWAHSSIRYIALGRPKGRLKSFREQPGTPNQPYGVVCWPLFVPQARMYQQAILPV